MICGNILKNFPNDEVFPRHQMFKIYISQDVRRKLLKKIISKISWSTAEAHYTHACEYALISASVRIV